MLERRLLLLLLLLLLLPLPWSAGCVGMDPQLWRRRRRLRWQLAPRPGRRQCRRPQRAVVKATVLTLSKKKYQTAMLPVCQQQRRQHHLQLPCSSWWRRRQLPPPRDELPAKSWSGGAAVAAGGKALAAGEARPRASKQSVNPNQPYAATIQGCLGSATCRQA